MAYSHVDPPSPGVQYLSPQAPVLRSSRWLALLGAGLGLVAVSAGVTGCSRPAASGDVAKPAYSEEQVADAKKAVCVAFEKGLKALQVSLNKAPDTTTGTYSSVLLNARIAELGVANFLVNALEANPATPADLRGMVTEYTDLWQKVLITQLGDGAQPEIAPMDERIRELAPRISQSCQ